MRNEILSVAMLCAVFLAPAPGAAATATGGRLEFADKVRLVTCDPALKTPCFRIKVSLVNASGAPLGAVLPDAAKLAEHVTVTADNQQVSPFFVSASSGEGRNRLRPRIALVLIDVSGSMNEKLPSGQTRFEAARAAARTLADGFIPGVDRIAVAPFASRDVVAGIRGAGFARTAGDLRRAIDNLQQPEPRNNTALYTAVDSAITVLKEQARAEGDSAEVLLLTMTDGKNDVQASDDPGLLAGDAGLDETARRVKESGIQTVGVGFGNRAELDESALRRISTETYFADDPGQLKQVFSFAHALLRDRLTITFSSPWKDRSSLAGRTIPMEVSLGMPDGTKMVSGQAIWQAPQIGEPAYEGRCEAAESRAALATADAVEVNGWFAVLRPALVFGGFSLLFFVLWFWVPRLIWPDRYLGDLQSIYYRRKWTGAGGMRRPGRPAASANTRSDLKDWGRPLPPVPAGFSPRGGPAVRDRAPGEATYVQPRPDPGTRTRLDFEWTDSH